MKNKWVRWMIFIVYIVALMLGIKVLNTPEEGETETKASKQKFATVKVLEVISDDATPDTWTEGLRIGSQYLKVEIVNGEYKGTELETWNYLNAYYNVDAKVGTKLLVILDYDENGDVAIASIFNYDRTILIALFIAFFLAIIVLIGGKKGVSAILGLVFTLVMIWGLLLPLIVKGFNPVLCTIAIVASGAAVSLILLNGFSIKTLCATLGCIGGVASAGIVAWLVGRFANLSGFNLQEAESIILLTSGFDIKVRGLLISGILISALGAVMDVAMSIASSIYELVQLNQKLQVKEVFKSGMNIGRDAMGTMTNTLILAFTGTSLGTLILFKIYDYPITEILNSDYMCMEILEGVSGSIGIILTIPLVAFLSAHIMIRKEKGIFSKDRQDHVVN